MNNIKKLREEHKQTAAELGAAIGRSQPTICKWENSRKLKYEDAKKIASYYKVPVYEVTGEAPENYIEIQASTQHMVAIPIYDIKQNINHIEEQDKQLISISMLNKMTSSKPEDIKIYINRGDAMSPTISDNDLTWIDTSITQAKENGIYLFSTQSQLTIKRLCFNEFTSTAELISDNSIYPSISVPDTSKLSIIGKVIAIHKFIY